MPIILPALTIGLIDLLAIALSIVPLSVVAICCFCPPPIGPLAGCIDIILVALLVGFLVFSLTVMYPIGCLSLAFIDLLSIVAFIPVAVCIYCCNQLTDEEDPTVHIEQY